MSCKILAVVPDEIDLGFELAGVDTLGCVDSQKAKESLENELAEKRYDIVLVGEDFIKAFDSRFNKRLQEAQSPLVMAIPLKTSLKEEVSAKDYFLTMVQSAIGYEIRIK